MVIFGFAVCIILDIFYRFILLYTYLYGTIYYNCLLAMQEQYR